MSISPPRPDEYIIHIDGDAFFVSCELVRLPHLRTGPVVVGRERGIAVAFNSHAKALGITRAMPIHQIRREFPQVVILSSHFELYKSFSKRMVFLVSKYVSRLEVYSIDEVFCVYQSHGDVLTEIKNIQKEIYDTLGITVSCGIAKTKVLAKLATSVQKPNAATLIDETNRIKILKNIAIEDVWGIGGRTSGRWQARGIVSAYDFSVLSESVIIAENAPVRDLYYELQGISRLPAIAAKNGTPQKSFQSTESFPKTSERAFLFSEISRHTEILCTRIGAVSAYTDAVNIYLKDSFGLYHSADIKLANHTQNSSEILNQLEKCFGSLFNPNSFYKSTGVTFVKVESIKSAQSNTQKSLFSELVVEGNKPALSTSLEALKGSVNAKFGSRGLYIGSSSISKGRKTTKASELAETDDYVYGLPLIYLGEAK